MKIIFFRPKKKKIRIAFSNSIGFYHNRIDYPSSDLFYKQMRNRVFGYLEKSLDFNNLTEIIFFGKSLIKKDPLKFKSDTIFAEIISFKNSSSIDFYSASLYNSYEINSLNTSCYRYIAKSRSRKYKNIYRFSELLHCKYLDFLSLDSRNHTDRSIEPLRISIEP